MSKVIFESEVSIQLEHRIPFNMDTKKFDYVINAGMETNLDDPTGNIVEDGGILGPEGMWDYMRGIIHDRFEGVMLIYAGDEVLLDEYKIAPETFEDLSRPNICLEAVRVKNKIDKDIMVTNFVPSSWMLAKMFYWDLHRNVPYYTNSRFVRVFESPFSSSIYRGETRG